MKRTPEGIALNKGTSEFGNGVEGAQKLLDKVRAGERGIPQGTTAGHVRSYAKAVAENQKSLISKGKADHPGFGVMQTRLEIYKLWLKGK